MVDLNRQSLDRIVSDIAAGRIQSMFEAAGWQTITVKYGRFLRELFGRKGGETLRRRIDGMPNEEYQGLLEVETDKANMTVEAEGSGALEILVEEGEAVAVGTPIARLGGEPSAVVAPVEPSPAPEPIVSSPAETAPVDPGTRLSTPLARRLARVHGIDIGSISGSGLGGRIVKADVLVAAGIEPTTAPDTTPAAAPAGSRRLWRRCGRDRRDREGRVQHGGAVAAPVDHRPADGGGEGDGRQGCRPRAARPPAEEGAGRPR